MHALLADALNHHQGASSSLLTLDIFLCIEIILIASEGIPARVHSMGKGMEV